MDECCGRCRSGLRRERPSSCVRCELQSFPSWQSCVCSPPPRPGWRAMAAEPRTRSGERPLVSRRATRSSSLAPRRLRVRTTPVTTMTMLPTRPSSTRTSAVLPADSVSGQALVAARAAGCGVARAGPRVEAADDAALQRGTQELQGPVLVELRLRLRPRRRPHDRARVRREVLVRRRGRRRGVALDEPRQDLDADLRQHADAVHRHDHGQPGRSLGVGRDGRGEHELGLLSGHRRVPVDEPRELLPASGWSVRWCRR